MGGKVFPPSWRAWQKDMLGTHPSWDSAKIQMKIHFKSHLEVPIVKHPSFPALNSWGQRGQHLPFPLGMCGACQTIVAEREK